MVLNKRDAKPLIIPIILAGGSGTSLWPLSRKSYPKSLLNLIGNSTLLQNSLRQGSLSVASSTQGWTLGQLSPVAGAVAPRKCPASGSKSKRLVPALSVVIPFAAPLRLPTILDIGLAPSLCRLPQGHPDDAMP